MSTVDNCRNIIRIIIVVFAIQSLAGCAQMAAAQLAVAAVDALDKGLRSASSRQQKTSSTTTSYSKPSATASSQANKENGQGKVCVMQGTYIETENWNTCNRLGGLLLPSKSVNVGCKTKNQQNLFKLSYCSSIGGVVDNYIPAKCSDGRVTTVFDCLSAGLQPVSLSAANPVTKPSTVTTANSDEPTRICSLPVGGVVRATAAECSALGGRFD